MQYGYSARGQLTGVTDWLGATAVSYDHAGRRTGSSRPNGTITSLTHDNADRLTGIAHARGGTTLEAISYGLDAAGRRTSLADNAGTTTWGYDGLDRLTSAQYPNSDQLAYGYDQVGNRTGHTVNGATTTNTFETADWMTACGPTTFAYDTNGNQLGHASAGATTRYCYDPLDRLIVIATKASAARRRWSGSTSAGRPTSTQRSGVVGDSSGSTHSTAGAIANTTDDALYQSERYGTFSYAFSLANGLRCATPSNEAVRRPPRESMNRIPGVG